MNEWGILVARLSLLTTAPSLPSGQSAQDIYKRIWDSEPEQFQRSQNPLFPSIAQGRHAGFTTACNVAPTRIDINLMPTATLEQISQPTVQTFENPKQLRTELTRIASDLGKAAGSETVNRVAVFLQFVNVKPSVQETNNILMSVIPEQYRVKITDEEGFILQFSKRRPVPNVEGINLNLLTKWSAEQLQVVTFAVSMDGQMPVPMTATPVAPRTQLFNAACVSFDYNTVVSANTLRPEQQSFVLLEGLKQAARNQKQIGLNVDGFNDE